MWVGFTEADPLGGDVHIHSVPAFFLGLVSLRESSILQPVGYKSYSELSGLGIFCPLVEISLDPSIFSEAFLPSTTPGIPQNRFLVI